MDLWHACGGEEASGSLPTAYEDIWSFELFFRGQWRSFRQWLNASAAEAALISGIPHD
jgi:hypothetical protein